MVGYRASGCWRVRKIKVAEIQASSYNGLKSGDFACGKNYMISWIG